MKSFRLEELSGQILAEGLHNKLAQEEYDKLKIAIWEQMMNRGKRPAKFLKPQKNGTKVNYSVIQSQEEYEEAAKDFSRFLNEMNKKHGWNIRFQL